MGRIFTADAPGCLLASAMISRADVEHVAALARLGLTDAELTGW